MLKIFVHKIKLCFLLFPVQKPNIPVHQPPPQQRIVNPQQPFNYGRQQQEPSIQQQQQPGLPTSSAHQMAYQNVPVPPQKQQTDISQATYVNHQNLIDAHLNQKMNIPYNMIPQQPPLLPNTNPPTSRTQSFYGQQPPPYSTASMVSSPNHQQQVFYKQQHSPQHLNQTPPIQQQQQQFNSYNTLPMMQPPTQHRQSSPPASQNQQPHLYQHQNPYRYPKPQQQQPPLPEQRSTSLQPAYYQQEHKSYGKRYLMHSLF